MTNYPDALDTDLELPRVDDNITEIGGDAINAIRDAIFAIESALGINPQGDTPSLADRIEGVIDADGDIKTSALTAAGLVTLPITNSQIGATAGIQESKLDLDYSTISLRNLISSLQTDTAGLQTGIGALTSNFNLHITGQGKFHDGYHIKINSGTFVGVGGLSATTVGDALNEMAGILFGPDGHIDLFASTAVKHTASGISIDTSNFAAIDRTVSTVQEALDDIDQSVLDQQSGHVDGFHANGILKSINSGEFYNVNQQKLEETSASYSQGSTVVTLPSVSSFSDLNISVGDILQIEDSSLTDSGTYKIRAIGPLTSGQSLGDLPSLTFNQVSVFHVFSESQSSVSANIYAAASVSSENAPLACAIKHSATLVDTPTILNPDAARVVSLGFNGAVINGDGYDINIEVGLGNGHVRALTIPNLNRERLSVSQASVVDATSVAERINAYVSDPTLGYHFPVSAFRIGNELAIAHNLVGPEFTLKVLDGYTANFGLGLDAYGADVLDINVKGNSDNLYNVNGKSLSSLRTLVDGYASISGATDTFTLYQEDGTQVNPIALGIATGATLHITGHPTRDTNGSYTIASVTSTTVSIFAAETVDAPLATTTFNVRITDSNISLYELASAETDNGLVQLYVDENGKVLVHQKLTYGTTLGVAVEIVNVSAGFPTGDVTLTVSGASTTKSFTILADSLSGVSTNIHEDFKGTIKVYHSNNIDYLVLNIVDGSLITTSETVSVYDSINTDEALHLATLHFNGSISINNVVDARQFGNLGADQIRDDFIEIFSQRPVADLRSDGVARGFDLLNIPYIESITGMQALPLSGGTAYVNGTRVVVETQRVVMQSYDSSGNLITGPRTLVVGINEFGTIRAFDDELGELLSDGYNSSAIFGKVLPLYTVDIANGLITNTVDVRKFINNLDDKIDLIVDETNNVVGSFRGLEGALLYARSYPFMEKLTIRVMNTVMPLGQLIVPSGVSIIGNAIYGGDRKHAIINQNDINDAFIILQGDNKLENIQIESTVNTLDGPLVSITGTNVEVNKCLFTFTDPLAISSNSSDYAIDIASTAIRDVRITNNRVNNVFSGIVSASGCERLVIQNNEIQNVAGTAVIAHGIFVGTDTTAVDNVSIEGNTIIVGNIGTGDIRGISIDIDQTIGTLRVSGNNVQHDNNNTMTNGIRIENSGATGNVVEELIVQNNTINGIKLNDNDIWGMYLANATTALVDHNVIKNVGQAGNTSYGFLYAQNITYLDINNNILTLGDVDRGIDVSSITGAVKVTNNTIKEIGASAIYIFGAGVGGMVSNNTLIGPGTDGIRWTGTNSSITGNNLSASSGSYAFSRYGIFALTSNIEICNNMVTGMTFSEDSIGISNGGTGRNYANVSNNFISGDTMASLIQLYSSYHVVDGNILVNTSDSSSGTTFMELTSLTHSIISNNVLQGIGTYGMLGVTATTSCDIVGNKLTGGSFGTNALDFDNTSTCTFNTNSVPFTSTSNIVGNSVIGTNQGLARVIGVPLLSGWSESGGDRWTYDDANNYWVPSGTGSTYVMYFPLLVPDGTRLETVGVGGQRSSATITLQVYRTDVAASTDSLRGTTTVSAGTTFTTTVSASSDYADNATSSYHLRVSTTGTIGLERIFGVYINVK